MPKLGSLGVDPGRGGPLAHAQAGVLVGAQEAPELEVVVARQTFQPAPEVPPQHGHTPDQYRVGRQAIDGDGQIVERRGPHEVLPEPDPQPPGPDALMAGALRAQVDEAEGLEINALGKPAEHTGAVTVDAVPHDLAHEAADLLKAGDSIELGHAHRHLVAADLRHKRTAVRMDEVGLAGSGSDPRIALHPLHQQLEVADRELQIHVQLTDIVEVLQPHRLQAGVERRDHTRAHLPMAAIGAPHQAQVGQSAGVRLQDGRGIVSRSVVYDYPKGWRYRLSCHAVESATKILGLVPAWRDEQVSSRWGHADI
jgi:hypothetical protein